MWSLFGRKKGPENVVKLRIRTTKVDTGFGKMVDLRPLLKEALRLRPSVPVSQRDQIEAVLVTSFNRGKTEHELRKLGLSDADANFISNRVMKWAFWERDRRDQRAVKNNEFQTFNGLRLRSNDTKCASAKACGTSLLPFDAPPRIPFKDCDQTVCYCRLEPVAQPRRRRVSKR